MINIFMSAITIVALIAVAYSLSASKKDVNWRTVIVGLIGQIVIVLFLLKVPVGQKVLEGLALGFQNVINFGLEGVAFVFGPLSSDMFIFGVNVLSLIVFSSALISVLYFLKVIPFIIDTLGYRISKLLGVSKVESMCCVANSFLGGNEALIVVKPYLPRLTRSEFFTCMTSCFGSASVGILAGYAGMLGESSMKYLLLAIFTVPFACLMFGKILIPETEVSEVKEANSVISEDKNIFDAIASGAMSGGNVVLAVAFSLIAFVGLTALLDGILGLMGLSFSQILSWAFYPIGLLLNIPASELSNFTQILGVKTGVNEFLAFSQLAEVMNTLSPRTLAILTVSCVNFCNFSVIAINAAGLKILCPERVEEFTNMGMKVLFTGILSTLSTGAIVGMMF